MSTHSEEFVEWIIDHRQVDSDPSNKTIFSDEAHFHLDGIIKRQNSRIWGLTNLHEIVEKQMNPQCVTLWCEFWTGGIIGPYFFENETGQAVNITGAQLSRYDNISSFCLNWMILIWICGFNKTMPQSFFNDDYTTFRFS